jgi:hypothetical protein
MKSVGIRLEYFRNQFDELDHAFYKLDEEFKDSVEIDNLDTDDLYSITFILSSKIGELVLLQRKMDGLKQDVEKKIKEQIKNIDRQNR